MDHKASRQNSKQSQDFGSSSAQCFAEAGHSLSDRVAEYYEKLVKNSNQSQSSPSNPTQQRPASLLHQSQVETEEFGDNPTDLPRFRDSSPSRSFSAVPSYPYMAYVEDPSGVFQRFHKKKTFQSSSPTSTASQHHSGKSTTSSRSFKRNKSPSSIGEANCPQCSQNHSPHSCPLKSRIPAEQDTSVLNKSPIYVSSKLSECAQPRDVFEKSEELANLHTSSKNSLSKGSVHAFSHSSERDVIGQERSPVSKSQPSTSLALSTSSSNGDSVPRERRKWARPPLVGQAATSADKSLLLPSVAFDNPEDGVLVTQLTDVEQDGSQQQKSSYFDSSSDGASGTPANRDEFFASKSKASGAAILTSEGEQGLSDSCGGGRVSPSSSVTSSRRLEWDSGADVGYNQDFSSGCTSSEPSGLCTIERMALAQGCSVALRLRLDPEGTTVPIPSSTILAPATVPPTPQQVKLIHQSIGNPTAESTPLERVSSFPNHPQVQKNVGKNGISPILNTQQQGTTPSQAVDMHDRYEINENPIQPVQRQWSNSLQDLRRFAKKYSEGPLFKSQSDPDLAGDSPVVGSKSAQTKISRGILKVRNLHESNAAVHSMSSGSDATLVHVEMDEDLCMSNGKINSDQPVNEDLPSELEKKKPDSYERDDMFKTVKEGGNIPNNEGCHHSSEEPRKSVEEIPINSTISNVNILSKNKGGGGGSSRPPAVMPQLKTVSKKHICSDTDHRRGLHHHFGVLCSTVLGGHIQSNALPNVGFQPENAIPTERPHASVDEVADDIQPIGEEGPQECEVVTADSATSSALHSDAAHEDGLACGNTLTGRANSFEYLPGHIFENKNVGPGCSRHEQPPGISTSTETDSEPVRPMSRAHNHSRVVDSSSLDTEEDRLWGSPRVGSNTLVQDIERGLNLLKGVMENKSAGRRSKREVLRRVIRKLVTSEYVEDLIEKEKHRHHVPHGPFSPRRLKHHDWPERYSRSKRTIGIERQEVSGESDEPKRVQNPRKKGNAYQVPPASQLPLTHSILASGSKSSSLWSSQCDTTSGSISLSGSSDHQKTSKSSMKPNPLYKPATTILGSTEWIEPTSHSEKLFQSRKQNVAGNSILNDGIEVSKPTEDPSSMICPSDPKQQLVWVKNEINRLKMLKQLLLKKELGEKSIDPRCQPYTVTALPLTSLKQTLKMMDCFPPDVPESQRLQRWATLESDTSAFCAQSGSSRDSHWQGIEIASAGEQDNRPHRTVSLSEGDDIPTEDVGPSSSNKTDRPQSYCPQKARRRSVNISDNIQGVSVHQAPDMVKKRSDRPTELVDGRSSCRRPAGVSTAKPQERVYASDLDSADICRNCHSVANGVSSFDSRSTASRLRETSGTRRGAEAAAGSFETQSLVNTGAVRKTPVPTSDHSAMVTLTDNQMPPYSVSRYIQTNEASLRIRTYVDQEGQGQGLMNSMDSAGRPAAISDLSEKPIARSASDDSVTRAVTQAVSSKVRALRNIGHIEEAEVKIRLKVGQLADDVNGGSSKQDKVWKSQEIEEDRTSKHSEIEEMIARQTALDQETRKKLISIAESRQRALSGGSDTDHRIQDLLLQDYLNRQQPKSSNGTAATRARLNVFIDSSQLENGDIAARQKKTVGTSTGQYTYENYSQTTNVLGSSIGSNLTTCTCTRASFKGSQPDQQFIRKPRPQTAPATCSCACTSAPERSLKPSLSSRERKLEFELQISKKSDRPRDFFDVRRTLKERNKAYFLQFEEDESVSFEDKEPLSEKPPLEVVTVKVPKSKTCARPSVKNSRVPSKPFDGRTSGEDITKYSSSDKENSKGVLQSGAQRCEHINAVGSSQYAGNRNTNRGVFKSVQSGNGSLSGSMEPSSPDSRGKSFASAEMTDSPLEMCSNTGKTSSEVVESVEVGTDTLKQTLGRSHLSITITDSSADSIRSPDGDSGSSSSHLPSKKIPRSRSPTRFESHYKKREGGGKRGGGKVFRTMAFGAGNPSNSPSARHQRRAAQAARHPVPDGGSGSDGVDAEQNFLSLQDYLEKNYPEYLRTAEKRRRCIAEMAYLRRLRQQSRKRLLELEGDSLRAKQRQLRRARCLSRPRPLQRKRTPPKNIKAATAKRCRNLPENLQRLAELKRQEEHRVNRLMAEIYTRKLQEKVLKGSATIRSSVSVISSL